MGMGSRRSVVENIGKGEVKVNKPLGYKSGLPVTFWYDLVNV